MKEISVTHDIVVLVDDQDYEILKGYNWHFVPNKIKTSLYATTLVNGKDCRMHQLIMGKKKGYMIDHIDQDSLNNQRSNLRFVTRSRNILNQRISIRNKTGLNGVYFDQRTGKYKATLTIDKVKHHLGSFSSLGRAKKARLEAEQKHCPGIITHHNVKPQSFNLERFDQRFFKQKKNRSGYRCVYINRKGRYYTRYHLENSTIHLGTYDTPLEAAKVYVAYFEKIHGKPPYTL